MTVLAFRLFGPLAAWGTEEAGNAIRPTATRPGKSAVLGILAAALGLRREDEDSHRGLAVSLLVATAAHGPRRVMRDFRTVQTLQVRRGQRFVSRRQALADGTTRTMV